MMSEMTMDDSIPVIGIPRPDDNFEPVGYLWANPDVEAASPPEKHEFAREHFRVFGRNEGRVFLDIRAMPRIAASRKTKLRKLRERSPQRWKDLETYTFDICGESVGALKLKGEVRVPVPYESISRNFYDPDIEREIAQHPDKLYLDVGAGLRVLYRENVVYTEIAALPTTDVLCFGDDLPFDDNTFDGLLCFAVLEHVPDPLAVAREMMRVAKPGAKVVVDWPNLQPLHGYPHHYFNATVEGARDAFARIAGVSVDECYVPWNGHPAWTLHWIIGEWASAMAPEDREKFLNMPMREVLDTFAGTRFDNPWATSAREAAWIKALPESVHQVISAVTRVIATKPDAS